MPGGGGTVILKVSTSDLSVISGGIYYVQTPPSFPIGQLSCRQDIDRVLRLYLFGLLALKA
jgi:hypothetical protein